ncbi:hypothetical protein LTS10_004176 [Elasticomyces elasticus]|nr:hypothetical protein LTS10_004176 [Elasticomyces elasticus]
MPNDAIPRSSDKAVMLQRYMALHAQQAAVRRRLSTSPSPPTSPKSAATTSPSMSTSESSSATSSPTLSGHNFSQISPPTLALPKPSTKKTSSRRPSMTPIPEDASIDDTNNDANNCYFPISPDEHKLYDVNHNIKSTLTELLNCDALRHDPKMRLWVQTRLLDAERELKRQRRRRMSAPSIAVHTVDEDGNRRSSS